VARRRPQRLLAVHPAGRTNWPKTLGQPQGTLSQYVNLQVLKTLQASVTATATTHRGGQGGAGLAATVMIRLLPARGRAQGHRGGN